MALRIERREIGGVHILALAGRLVYGEETSALREAISELLLEEKRNIVLNLGDLTFIDSAGLGELVRAHQAVKAEGGMLKLTRLGARLQDVLQIGPLLEVFEVFPTEAVAVGSFGWWCQCDKHGAYLGPPPCPKCQ